MQVVRRDTIRAWSVRVVARPAGHYLLMSHPDSDIPVVKFLAADLGQSMRMVDRIVERETGERIP